MKLEVAAIEAWNGEEDGWVAAEEAGSKKKNPFLLGKVLKFKIFPGIWRKSCIFVAQNCINDLK